ncbi:DUF4355 domain-containing protein [Lentilactobacillus sp. SPB1-3]|uniref:DUF4355 domain-containing protein n=1 Tax=Lentilactobacillus terminaliae TaxID=3003483 RepID=A0ACD5DCW5_9LACO|nr:DUF4355 domain-containing protein [Lentilactobacillus sp. SPB1-3]MCZ0978082.1 DUF4355 domain-containing protein [Lentilactobacillus sp. SPB1-3]
MENETNDTQENQGSNSTQGNQEQGSQQPNEPKNVDQKELREKLGKIDSLTEKIDQLFTKFNQTNDAKPEQPNESQESSELDKLKQQLNEQKHRDSLNLAKNTAKESDLEIDGLESFFVGDNDDATKANVKSFADYMKAHDEALKKSLTASTDTGFNTTRSDRIGDSKDFLGSILDEQFGPQK